MITERMIKRLDNLIAKYAYRDYRAACGKFRRQVRSYTLSETTNEAREMHNMALKRKDVNFGRGRTD